MKQIIIPVAAGLIGAAAGFYAGFVYGDRKGRTEVWALAEAELDANEERIMRRYKVGEWAEPLEYFDENEVRVLSVPTEDLVALQEHVNNGGNATLVPATPYVVRKNIFDKDEVVEEEIEVPPVDTNPNQYDPEPLIITDLEYMQDEEDYEKLSVSWFPGDRVLVDSKEQPVDDIEGTVGFNNLNTMSITENTVIYIRNNRLQHDYEVVIEEGTYRETVLGEDTPIVERTRTRKPRRPKVDTDE